MEKLLFTAIKAAVEAGKAILEIYKSDDFGIEEKDDNSPLTLADKAAHNIIEHYLLETNIAILSEEGRHEAYEHRKNWDRLWIVDPLDGTKEFVKKTGEFTVNIALIESGYPIGGVVFVPCTKTLYYASHKEGAFKVELTEDWENKREIDLTHSLRLPIKSSQDKLIVVASVSHLSKETAQFVDRIKEKYGDIDISSVGSSIKICKVAEGSADIYPRLGPTMEWDTAAGQAISEAAGAIFLNWKTKKRFDYNRPNLLNDWFVVTGDRIPEKELTALIQYSGL